MLYYNIACRGAVADFAPRYIMPETFVVETFPPGLQGRSCMSASDPAVLPAIFRPQVNAAVWGRRLPAAVPRAAAALSASGPFVAVTEAAPDRAADALVQRVPVPLPAALLHDVRLLSVLFAMLTGRPEAVRVRLEAIHGPGCWRWHADAVGLRLLCTYSGPGTEIWTASAGAEAARTLPRTAAGTVLPTGAVVLLKGEGFPGNAGAGCIHRAPQDAGPRLLLCLDEPGRIPCE